jgi:hypothetical protein
MSNYSSISHNKHHMHCYVWNHKVYPHMCHEQPPFVWQKPHSLVVKPMVLRRGCVMPAALASKFLNMSYTYDYNTSITNWVGMIERLSAIVNQPGLQATHFILVDFFCR